MSSVLIMAVGWFVGYKFFKEKYVKANSLFQTVCVAILIFCMGVSLGGRDDFFSSLFSLGKSSLIYSLVPILFSVLVVYALTEILLVRKSKKEDEN